VRAEREDHSGGFDAEVLVSPASHWKTRPDTIRHEQGTEALRRHSDHRMRFVHDVNVALLGVEATPVGLSACRPMACASCKDPATTPISARASNSISRLSMTPAGGFLSRLAPPHAVRSVMMISVRVALI